MPGFGLMVTDKGAKSYVVQYRASRRSRRMTISSVLDLSKARTRAKVLLGEVANGRDPLGEKRMAEAAATNTLRHVAESYLSREGKNLRSLKNRKSTFERHIFPALTGCAAFFFVAPICHHTHAWHKRRIARRHKSGRHNSRRCDRRLASLIFARQSRPFLRASDSTVERANGSWSREQDAQSVSAARLPPNCGIACRSRARERGRRTDRQIQGRLPYRLAPLPYR
jgi:hypothetical protein